MNWFMQLIATTVTQWITFAFTLALCWHSPSWADVGRRAVGKDVLPGKNLFGAKHEIQWISCFAPNKFFPGSTSFPTARLPTSAWPLLHTECGPQSFLAHHRDKQDQCHTHCSNVHYNAFSEITIQPSAFWLFESREYNLGALPVWIKKKISGAINQFIVSSIVFSHCITTK